MSSCTHDGFQSGEGRYCHETQSLRYVLVCDECHEEIREVHAETYRPSFNPTGNDGFLKAA